MSQTRSIITVYRLLYLLVCLCFFSTIKSQNCHIEISVIALESNLSLDFANLGYKYVDEETWKMVYTDAKGQAEIVIEEGRQVEVLCKYLGYKDFTQVLDCATAQEKRIIKMEASSFKIDEIVITEKFPPIVIKKDTIVYDVSEFASGNEEKLKELMNKLPGLHVDRDNIVTFNGERVQKILIDNQKFITGDPSLAVKFIPANAVEKVEVLERYNPIKALQGTSINEELTINVRLKEDKKKLVFGEITAGSDFNKRHQFQNNLFYFSPRLTVNNISEFTTGRETILTASELNKLFANQKSGMDPKGRQSGDHQIRQLSTQLNSDLIYDRKTLMGVQQIKYTFKNQSAIEMIGMGADLKDKMASMSETVFNGLGLVQTSSTQTEFFNRMGNIDINFASNPSANAYFTYTFSHNLSPSQTNHFSDAEISRGRFLQTNDNEFLTISNNHQFNFTAAINDRWQFLTEYQYKNQNSTESADIHGAGLSIPSAFLFRDSVNLVKNYSSGVASHYSLTRFNYKLDRSSNLNLYYRLSSKNEKFDNGLKSSSFLDGTFIPINTFENDFTYGQNLHILGTRYQRTGKYLEWNLGLDFHRLSLKFGELHADRDYLKLVPDANVKYNINRVGELNLAYSFDYGIPEWQEVGPGIYYKDFNAFSKGNTQLRPEEGHKLSLTLRRPQIRKGRSQSLNFNYSKSLHPIIASVNYSENAFIQSYENIEMPSHTLSGSYLLMFTKPKNVLINQLTFSRRIYSQDIAGTDSRLSNFLFLHRLDGTRSWKNLELNLNNRFTVLGLPGNSVGSTNFISNQTQAKTSFYFTDEWKMSFEPSWYAVKSAYSSQNSFILDAQLSYSFMKEKFKLRVSAYNITGVNSQNAASSNTYRSQITSTSIFPRYILLSISYVY